MSGRPLGTDQVRTEIEAFRREIERLKAGEAEHRQNANELSLKTRMFEDILSASRVGICLVEDRVCKWANDELARIFGFIRADDCLGLSTEVAYVSSEEFEQIGSVLYPCLENGKPILLDIPLKRITGEIFEAQIGVSPIDPDNPRKRVVVTVTDVTVLRRVKQASRENEKNFKTLADKANDGILIAQEQGEFVYANQKAADISGYTIGELLNIAMHDLMIPEDGPAIYQQHQQRMAGEDFPQILETFLIRKNGSRAPLEVTVAATTWQGQPASLAIFRDVSSRKEAEEALRRSEAHFRLLADNSTDLIIHHALDGSMLYVSPAVQSLLGYTPEQVAGLSMFEFFHPEDIEAASSEFLDVATIDKTKYVEYRVRHELGHYIWLGTSSKPYFDSRGQVAGIIAVSRDITAQKLAEESLQKMHDELEARVAQRTAELEELNTALREEIAERERVEEKLLSYQERLRAMGAELSLTEERERRQIAMDLHDHIGQCLALSKLKLRSLRQTASSIELGESLDEVISLVDTMAEEARSLTLDLSPPILYDLGLTAALEWLTEEIQKKHGLKTKFLYRGKLQGLDNDFRVVYFRSVRELLMNVVKHAQASEAAVTLHADDKMIRIEVIDNGNGFNVSSLVENDWTDSGFGLFSVRERLSSLGGRLEIRSVVGQGTRATIEVRL